MAILSEFIIARNDEYQPLHIEHNWSEIIYNSYTSNKLINKLIKGQRVSRSSIPRPTRRTWLANLSDRIPKIAGHCRLSYRSRSSTRCWTRWSTIGHRNGRSDWTRLTDYRGGILRTRYTFVRFRFFINQRFIIYSTSPVRYSIFMGILIIWSNCPPSRK